MNGGNGGATGLGGSYPSTGTGGGLCKYPCGIDELFTRHHTTSGSVMLPGGGGGEGGGGGNNSTFVAFLDVTFVEVTFVSDMVRCFWTAAS